MQQFDFNLLVTLDALLAEGSVRGAAARMNVTAPAMSHALARLRGVLGDPLLVRAGQRLVPTPRAIALRARVRHVVDEGRAVFHARPHDALGDARRTFTLRANGNAIAVLAVALVARVQAEAPGIQLRFAAEDDEGIGPLRDGSVDLALGVDAQPGPELCVERLYTDPFVAVVRAGHALASGRLTLRRYANAEHVGASRRGRARGPVDLVLEAHGLTRRVPVIVPDMLAAVTVAAGSDHVATVPRSVARWARRAMKVVARALPFATEPVTVFQTWHPRFELDPVHRWVRACVRACAQRGAAGAASVYRT